MRADALAEWLPLALADILLAHASTWGKPEIDRADILAGWGLITPAAATAKAEHDWETAMLAAGATITETTTTKE